MSKELDDAYFRSTPCTHHEPLLSKLVDCVDLLEERIKGLLGAKVYVGDTDTLPAGSEAMVSASKHGYDTMLEFGIPSGKDGSDAEATDVRINGTSITADGVADIPLASNTHIGLVKLWEYGGMVYGEAGLETVPASEATISARNGSHYLIPADSHLDYAVKAAMCDGKGAAWTDNEQQAARERMNAADANKVYIMQKQIENLQGIAATEETDSTEAYTKTVPTGAQKWASLDKVGGKTVVNDGELVSAEVVEVESKGKNMLNPEARVNYPQVIRFYDNRTAIPVGKFKLEKGVTYTLSHSGKPSQGLYVRDQTSGNPTNVFIEYDKNSITFTPEKDIEDASFEVFYFTENPDIQSVEVQLERGTTATPYSPYGIKGTFPITDEVRDLCPGYGWSAGTVCNEIDFERKVYVQRVGSMDLGTLEWVRFSNGRMQAFTLHHTHANGPYDSVTNCTCSKYVATSAAIIESSSPVDKTVALGENSNTFAVYDSDYTDADTFKSAMAGQTLYYELAEPIEVDLSDMLPDDHYIEVEAGGTVTFKQASTQLPVPSSVTYQISTSEVIANA